MSEKSTEGSITAELINELGMPDFDAQEKLKAKNFRAAETPQDRQHLKRVEQKQLEEETDWAPISKALGIADPKADDQIKQAEIRATLEKFLSGLKSEKQKDVLTKLYLEEKTLDEVAQERGITLEGVRQIEGRGLGSLRWIIRKNKKLGIQAD